MHGEGRASTHSCFPWLSPLGGGAAEGVDHSHRAMPVFIHDVPNGLGEYGYYGLPMM